jgi:hypothetical protein
MHNFLNPTLVGDAELQIIRREGMGVEEEQGGQLHEQLPHRDRADTVVRLDETNQTTGRQQPAPVTVDKTVCDVLH